MRKTFVVLIAVLFSGIVYSQNNAKNFIDQNYIEVTGTAEIEIIPDEVHIMISVNEKDFKTKQTFNEYEKKLVERLKKLGIPVEKEFSVFDMRGQLKTSIFGRDEVNSFKKYLLIVHSAQMANMVFEEAEKFGVSKIDVTKLSHSKIEQFKREVKINAIKAAKEKAGILTAAIGQQIGKALYIDERIYPNNSNNSNNQYANYTSKDELFKSSSNIGFRSIKLDYTILVRFALK